jgi:hypothetical protein
MPAQGAPVTSIGPPWIVAGRLAINSFRHTRSKREIDGFAPGRVLAAELHDLLHQIAGALGRLQDREKIGVFAAVFGQPPHGELRRRQHQGVVEVVGDAAAGSTPTAPQATGPPAVPSIG